MKILSLNINDFGGLSEHLFSREYRKANGYTDWGKWSKVTEEIQMGVVGKLTKLITETDPDVCVFQEFEINNSIHPKNFIETMKEKGYDAIGIGSIHYKASITMLFVKSPIMNKKQVIDVKHPITELTARDCAIRYENGDESYVIYGTHVPYGGSRRVGFWDEIIEFYKKNEKENLILIGDFNTFSTTTSAYQKYKDLLELGATDLWLKQGGTHCDKTELNHSSRLDYVFLSPSAINNCRATMEVIIDRDLSDHAALILDINNIKEPLI